MPTVIENYAKIKKSHKAFNIILERINEKGVLPKRGRKFDRAMISNIAHGKTKHLEVEEIIEEIANELN